MTRLEDLTPNTSIRSILPDQQIGVREPVLPRYERATFEKGLIKQVRKERLDRIARTEAAVKGNSRLNSGEARKRADLLQGRLQKRLEELRLEAQIAPLPPVIQGGFLVVPVGLILAMQGKPAPLAAQVADTQASAARARAIVMEVERCLGFEPVDRKFEKIGYDVESTVPGTGKLRFIEVKGRDSEAKNVILTKNEILRALNVPDRFRLAIVLVDGKVAQPPVYVREFDWGQPGFAQTHSTFTLAALLSVGTPPL